MGLNYREAGRYSGSRIVNRQEGRVERVRQILIELWAMLIFAAVVGFLGPFGTYLEADFPHRAVGWWVHLMGAYVLVRPSISIWALMARLISLPRSLLVFWGVLLSSIPLAALWDWAAGVFFHALGGFWGILPFALLSAVTVLLVVWWANSVDARLRQAGHGQSDGQGEQHLHTPEVPEPAAEAWPRPRLLDRLGGAFGDTVLALQSEDHYVRVHGTAGSELILMRLRDAIVEMDGIPGQQVHRSWWVARDGMRALTVEGRNRMIVLASGQSVPVARDSIAKLEEAGFFQALD